MHVKAAVCLGPKQPLVVDEVVLDDPREDEVLIEFTAAGLCHTDLMLIDGSRAWQDYPIVLGHEGIGIVRECGAGVTSLAPGDHVIPAAMPECGQCRACRSPKTNQCEVYARPFDRRPFRWRGRPAAAFCNLGTFAQYAVVREIQVARIRRDAPMDRLCCMGCAGITGLGAALFTARVEAGTSAAVFGLGGIGLNVVEGARLAGASMIIGIDTNPAKEAPARQAGMTHYLNPASLGQDVAAVVREMTSGGADYSFECVGHSALLRQAMECTRPGWGTTVSIGVITDTTDVPLRARALLEGRRVTGSILGNVKTRSQLPEMVDWYVDGKLRLDDLISHRIALEDINKGFELMVAGEATRVVIDF